MGAFKAYKLTIVIPFILCLGNMLFVYNINSLLYDFRNIFILLELMLVLAEIIRSRRTLAFPKNNMFQTYAFLFTSYILITIIMNLERTGLKLYILSDNLFALIILFGGIFFAKQYGSEMESYLTKVSVVFYFLFLTLFLFSFFSQPATSSPYNVLHAQYINSIYYLLCALPITLRKKKIKVFTLATAFVAVILSTKQTVLIALCLFTLVYVIEDNKQNHYSSRTIKTIIILFIIIIFAYISYIYILNRYGLDIMVGFASINEDGGNGRLEIYRMIINDIRESSLLQIIFGHGGAESVAQRFGISAHNDFLEVLYDYGALSFLIYVMMIISLIKTFMVFMKKEDKNGPILGATITMFIVISMFSHLVFILKYFMMLAIFFGAMTGIREEKQW